MPWPGELGLDMKPIVSIVCLLVAMLVLSVPARADRQQLLQEYRQVRQETARNPFDEPLFIRSHNRDERLGSDIYAVLPQSFTDVRAALTQADEWCRFLVLNQNVKACTWRRGEEGSQLSLFVGRKFYQPPQDAYHVDGAFEVTSTRNDFLRVSLRAAEGPLGTEDYRISVQAAPIDQGTLVQLSWGYEDSWRSRMATSAYLATLGKDKIGFSIVGESPSGKPRFVQGVRGMIERNAMRYYLALRAHLQTDGLPAEQQTEAGMGTWYRMVEHYGRQLHELSRDEYFSNKRRELQNQRRMQQRITANARARADVAD